MKEVKIYTIVSDQLSPPITGESFCTDMVRHSDYADLEEKCAALAAKLSMINDLMEAAEQANKLAHEATEKLVQERNALAAENELARKAVQSFCDVVGDNTEVISEEVGRDGVLVILEAMKATGNMPATDAFLAEVRAQGVEMAMEHMQSSGSLTFGDCYISLNEFATQLRKGAAL
ncbi:ead/Ea22-like family protein [Salmonella enterica]|nr:ead/Ea22-like family protein [Salmonella enterica subsp. enterica serovar 6,7:b:-]EHG2695443.1 ead/Ea22-like family protein [Salmonella enterica]EHG2700175.1 ead/Ea22-like family protein [Salmonella enterica]EHG7370985.1 ead/Ea22-like family protein [Salmonella enterica]EHG8105446.1 ead/Ea22-like family protein [Salmonella enterica]